MEDLELQRRSLTLMDEINKGGHSHMINWTEDEKTIVNIVLKIEMLGKVVLQKDAL